MAEARDVVQIRLSDQERLSGVMDPANLVEALVTLHRDGMSRTMLLTVRHRRLEQRRILQTKYA